LVSKIDSGPAVNSLLKNYARGDSGYYFHLPATGKAWFASQENQILDVVNRYKIRNFSQGTLKISMKNLYGYFVEIEYDNNRVGAIGVLYRDRNSSQLDRPGKIFRIILFYFFLFLMAAGGVAYYVSEFTSPLKKLENRVSAITAGKFNQKIEPQGEADEIGRLSFTLELMRKTIREKVTTIENLNINLENMVKERTIDLAKANEELKRTLAELKNAQKQLIATEKLAAFGRLLAGLAHEINNPVNSITNTLKPLDNLIDKITQNDPKPQDIQDINTMINILKRGTSRIRQVIDRITNTLKSDNSPREKIQVTESIENAISLIAGKLEDINIIKDFQKDAYISASPGAIEEVFENLIINAADAMEKSSEKVLEIKVKVVEQQVRIEFEDRGSGIPPQIREKIFDPFFTTKEVGGGMGLGLSIVNDIVKSYNGDLDIVSLEQGTRVVLVFPKSST
jgi:C4-dicarboxylate-specific signal transduction histidine kinase